MKMNKTQKRIHEYALDYSKYQMKQLVKFREMSANIPVPELPDEIYTIPSGTSFSLYIGFSPDNVRLVFNRFRVAGWRIIHDSEFDQEIDNVIATLKSGERSSESIAFFHDDFSGRAFYVWFIVGGTGSNCKRVKIGTEMVEQDVFEIVCNDGIAEMDGAL